MSPMAKGAQFTRYILPILHSLREMGDRQLQQRLLMQLSNVNGCLKSF